MTIPMTVDDARKLLKPPLRFGDPQQIEAVSLLERLETLLILGGSTRYSDYANCPLCDGWGTDAEHYKCNECRGHGRILTRFLTADQIDALLKYAERNNPELGMTA
jgi:hypothetical protein